MFYTLIRKLNIKTNLQYNDEYIRKQKYTYSGADLEAILVRAKFIAASEGEEVVCYIQMPADIWDALYGETDGEIAEYLIEQFEEFLDNHDMEYELTTYGRNAALIYKKMQ